VFQYEPTEGVEILLVDFSASAGDTLCLDPYIVILGSVGEYSYFGKTLRGWEVFVELDTLWTDTEYSLLIIDSLGIAKVFAPFWWGEVVGAQIDGKQYGTLVPVPFSDAAFPGTMQLNQNYPNPFNSGTMISFSLESRSSVTLTIHDDLGRQVLHIAMGQLQPGLYHRSIDLNGHSSGVYSYRLATERGLQQRRMIFIR
jgi:hypothetical protein